MYREDTGFNHVGFWARVVEYLIDSLAMGIVTWILGMQFVHGYISGLNNLIVQGQTGTADPAAMAHMMASASGFSFISFVVSVLNLIVLQGIRGQTIGKMVMGHYLVREDGSKPGWGVIIGRYFAFMLSAIILDIGFMMAGWTRHKQALHDIICGTYVIRRSKK